MTNDDRYLLDNQHKRAARRLAALSELFNPSTFRHLNGVGLGSGWRVWEAGAGGPSVPSWLAEQVAQHGHVLATDIDTAWIDDGTGGYEVRHHDVGVDPPPEGPFDVVHARLVLVHVPRRDEALSAIASVLRPGGWLTLEEADPALQPHVCLDQTAPAEQLANRLKSGFRRLLAQRGVDLAYGRTLTRRLRAAGLVDVAAEGYFPITGAACAELERATVEQLRDRLVAGGLASEAEIDDHLANVSSRGLDLATSPMITAWGRRPADN